MRSNHSPVNDYFQSLTESQLPEAFREFRKASDAVQRTMISLSALELGILRSLIQIQNVNSAKWIEVGTLTGFSAYGIASALPQEGHLWTLEKDPTLAKTARELLQSSEVKSKVTVVEGDAGETLKSIETHGPFDGIFVDGNKGAYPQYLDWAEKNLKPGALIVADNVFLGGDIWTEVGQRDPKSPWSASVVSRMQEFIRRLFDPAKYSTSIVPTQEGLLVAKKNF